MQVFILRKMMSCVCNTYGLRGVTAFQALVWVRCDTGDAKWHTVSELSIHYNIEVNPPRREIEWLKV